MNEHNTQMMRINYPIRQNETHNNQTSDQYEILDIASDHR